MLHKTAISNTSEFGFSEFMIQLLYMSTTFISDCVRVPVLSVQITVTRPSVSDAGNLRMRTFLFMRRWVAKESQRATTAGNHSGIAETAKLTATKNE